jgi:alpha-beta hydrolase superfamily lysophospholipase
MSVRQHQLTANDDHRISVYDWRAGDDSMPTAVIQVLHGLGEHALRYASFATACNERGISVVAHNHRGHGSLENFGHFADSNGWNKVIADVLQVRQHVAVQYPKVPVILMGHSMGSYIAQCFVMRHGGNNAALILSASTLRSRAELRKAHMAATVFARLTGKRRVSPFLNKLALGKLNDAFGPARTGYEWLTRDEKEVDKYVADPLCGGHYTNQLWSDLTDCLLEISAAKAFESVRSDMPILITGGSSDPLGGQSGLTRLAEAYRQSGHDDVTLTIYPDGRHEMLNESNRDEVMTDIIEWVELQLSNDN